LVVASHDLAILERTVDHVLAVDTDSAHVRRVPGGVEGWLRERRAATSPRRSLAASPAPVDGGAKAPSAYTIGRRLRDTEQEIGKAERARDRLVVALAAATDHGDLARIGAELAAAQTALAELEEQWLQLAEQQSG
jgi:ATPase subunit of ABC transporter with duplicated ATPase domains